MVCDNGFQTEFETKTIWKGCEVCNNRFEMEFETIRAGQGVSNGSSRGAGAFQLQDLQQRIWVSEGRAHY